MATLDADLLSNAEIEALLRMCSKRAPSGRRNRALLAVMYRCGLRVSEALALAVKDVQLDDGRIVVQRGKGGKRRIVGLDLGSSILIDEWLASRRKLRLGPKSPLFCTLAGGPIDSSYIRALCPVVPTQGGFT